MTGKKLKRHCYFNHKLGVERHVWGAWRKEEWGDVQNCERCSKQKSKNVNFSALITHALKKNAQKFADALYADNPTFSAMRKGDWA